MVFSIEIRGSSSQMFPKKSYGFETKSANLGNIYSSPIWDFNLTYGNTNYLDRWLATGFQYQANLRRTATDHCKLAFISTLLFS